MSKKLVWLVGSHKSYSGLGQMSLLCAQVAVASISPGLELDSGNFTLRLKTWNGMEAKEPPPQTWLMHVLGSSRTLPAVSEGWCV